MNDHPCAICRKTPAPFGYRMAGHYSRLSHKAYLWACADHQADAEARWQAANASPTAKKPEQGQLI